MRIQEQTDCHLSRLSRSLMTRTAFGRLLLMPTGHLALTRFIILLFLPQLPLPLPLASLFLLLSLSLSRVLFRPILSSCFYRGNARAIYLLVLPLRAPASARLSRRWRGARCDG